jgi:hypothetical protein
MAKMNNIRRWVYPFLAICGLVVGCDQAFQLLNASVRSVTPEEVTTGSGAGAPLPGAGRVTALVRNDSTQVAIVDIVFLRNDIEVHVANIRVRPASESTVIGPEMADELRFGGQRSSGEPLADSLRQFGIDFDGGDEVLYIVPADGKNFAPTLALVSPAMDTRVPIGGTLRVAWEDDDFDDNAVINLFIQEINGTNDEGPVATGGDTNPLIPISGQLPEDADGEGDEFSAIVQDISPGFYEVVGRITDGEATAESVAPGIVEAFFGDNVVAPSIEIIEPAEDVTRMNGEQLLVSWTDSDPDSDALVRIALRPLGELLGLDDITLIKNRREDLDGAGNDDANIPLTGLLAGDYQLMAFISDGVLQGSDEGPVVTIIGDDAGGEEPDNLPMLALTQPAVDIELQPNQQFEVRWTDSDENDNAVLSLVLDPDLSGNSLDGNEISLAAGIQEDPDGNADMANVQLPGSVVIGAEFRVAGVLTDGSNSVTAFAPGVITVIADITDSGGGGQPPVVVCEPPNICTTAQLIDGQCVFTAVDCNNGIFCDGNETCDTELGCVSSGNPCVGLGLVCDEELDDCRTCDHSAECDDGNACTEDICLMGNGNGQGGCMHLILHDTEEDCCDPNTGQLTEIDDHVPCTIDTCQGDGTVSHEPDDAACGEGFFCHASLGCVPDDGSICFFGTDCDDGDPCTEDICIPGEGTKGGGSFCVNPPLCPDDGLFCTGSQSCQDGECIIIDPPCVDLGLLCDEQTDSCFSCTEHAQCDDGNACTVDTCVPQGKGPSICVNEDQTHDTLCCNPETGELTTINDFVACTIDECQPDGSVTHTPDDTACDFGKFQLSCHPIAGCIDSGDCVADTDCDDGNACTDDTCGFDNEGQEGIVPLGICQSTLTDCDDAIGCTTDSCDPATGCINEPDDSMCDDQIPCTMDVCEPGVGCVHVPMNEVCADELDCTVDTCVVGFGCVSTPDHGFCDDGQECTSQFCRPETGGCSVRPGCPANKGDFDDDNDLDLVDFANLGLCFIGEIPIEECGCMDFDDDGDVDFVDMNEFTLCFTGPIMPPPPL